MTCDVMISVRDRIVKIFEDEDFRRYFANSSWLMGERILRMTLSVFVGAYVARYLGPDRFGQLNYALSLVGIFTAISMLGLDGIVVRDLVQRPENCYELLGTAFGLKLCGGFVAWCLLALAVLLSPVTNLERTLVLIIGAGLVFQSANVIDFYFQSKVESRYVVRAYVWQMLLSCIAKVALIWLRASLVWFAVVSLLDALVLTIMLLFIFFRTGNRWEQWKFSFKTAGTLLKSSWPLLLSGIAISVYMKIDQVMIRDMLDADAVGQYAAAVRISEAWYFVPMAIVSSLYPAIIRAKQRSEECYHRRLQQLYDVMVWLAVAVALPTTFLSGWVIQILFGSYYKLAGTVLAIHVWAGVFVALGVASGKYLLVNELQKIALLNTAVGAVLNVALNYWLLPRMGVVGAAVATIVSYAVAAYAMMFCWEGSRKNFFAISNSLFFSWLRIHKVELI